MNTTRVLPVVLATVGLGATLLVAAGCGTPTTQPTTPPKVSKEASFASNLKLEVIGEQRRVLLDAVVPDHTNGDQYIEFFLSTKRGGRGYESVLVADVDARKLNEALLAAKAVPGKPFSPDPYRPPTGQILKISLRYEKDGKQYTDVAQSWLKTRSGGEVHLDWVYTGSDFSKEDVEPNQQRNFLAEQFGTLITLGNSETALIDVSIPSASNLADLDMAYNIERMPPPGTKVTMIFEPVGEFKKGK